MYNKYNITTLHRFCGSPCNLYSRIIQSRIKYLKFSTVVDFVPSLVRCKIFYKLFLKYSLLCKAKYYDYQYQHLEVNKNIYTRYIVFKNKYVNNINLFIKKISNIENTIGIHYRMNDNCFKSECRVDEKVKNKFYNNIKKVYKQNISVIFISTINNKIAKSIANGFKYIQYMPLVKPVHVEKIKRNITSNEISKVIGDIILIASAKYLILSSGSTYSGLILAIGGLDSKGKKKKFNLYNKNGMNVNNTYIDFFKSHKCLPMYYSNI